MIVVALAGLPGSGKSTLARGLGSALGAPVFDKDRVRAALLEPGFVEYTREQDDRISAAIHALVRAEARERARRRWILDGRTYARRAQVDALVELARSIGAELAVLLCACSVETAVRRVAAARDVHPARDRGPELVRALAASFEPLAVPHCVIDTEGRGPAQALAAALAYLAERGVREGAR